MGTGWKGARGNGQELREHVHAHTGWNGLGRWAEPGSGLSAPGTGPVGSTQASRSWVSLLAGTVPSNPLGVTGTFLGMTRHSEFSHSGLQIRAGGGTGQLAELFQPGQDCAVREPDMA